MQHSVVVVGGGIAGVTCVEQLALEIPSLDILLVSASPLIKATTNVKKISNILEEFDVEERQCSTLEKRYSNVKVIIDTVTELNAKEHEIGLCSGQKITYKKLCLCAGARPKVILEDSEDVIGIRDTHTIKAFEKKLEHATRVVLVGNGGIATELVYEIENCEIIWVVKDKYIGATFFDAAAAEFFRNDLKEDKANKTTLLKRTKYSVEENQAQNSSICLGSSLGPDWSSWTSLKGSGNKSRNVTIYHDCEVLNIKSSSEGRLPVTVELSNNSVIDCNFVISATGVVPNVHAFVHGNKLTIGPNGGIQVNEQFETSEPDVYAAGDVCTASWDISEHWFQMRLWTQAKHMGAFAAISIAASLREEECPPLDICFDIFTHVTEFFGKKVVLLGLFNGQKLNCDYEILLRMTKSVEYVKVILKNGRMQGAMLIGDTDLEETFENLILNQLDLTVYGEDLLNPDVDIEDYFD